MWRPFECPSAPFLPTFASRTDEVLNGHVGQSASVSPTLAQSRSLVIGSRTLACNCSVVGVEPGRLIRSSALRMKVTLASRLTRSVSEASLWLHFRPPVPRPKKWAARLKEPFTRHFLRRTLSSSHGTPEQTNSTVAASGNVNKKSHWRYFVSKPLFLVQFFLGFGLLAIAFKQFRRINSHPSQSPELIAKNWEVLYYRIIPFRAISRAWGWLTNRELPVWARQTVLGLYARTFKCNLDEALDSNLESYPCLGEFFRRKLKSGARPIDSASTVVAPSDGTVLNFGKVTAGMMEQVKGVRYSLNEFLGPAYWRNGPEVQPVAQSSEDYEKSLLKNSEKNDLYHCVIYLAPGDYHCFHSPVNWTVRFRRHFPGLLLSVNPSIAKWVAGLFSLNERVVYVGEWEHGFFSMTPVGATNVGSIRIYGDQDLRTNCSKWHLPLPYYDRYMGQGESGDQIKLEKGQIFGEFNLGSTIVLIFEAPKDFEFSIQPGQKIRVGQSLHWKNMDEAQKQ